MMKLKYMVCNTDKAAEALLTHWEPIPTEIHFFRASSTFVHIFKVNGDWQFLRFSRVEERDLTTLEAELEFLLFLKENRFPAAYPILSKHGSYIETAGDGSGQYYGQVFAQAKGKPLSAQDRTPKQYEIWGRQLGVLHNLSSQYVPKTPRRSYLDYLADFKNSFTEWDENDALAELDMVKAELSSLNKTADNFGLIHYDFQYDNTFWDEEEKTFYAIDFDDAHYHFYAMDLVYALDDLDAGPADPQQCINAFYAGYKSVCPLDEDIMAHVNVFARYSNLMHFWQITRSMQESDGFQDPDWLVELRPKLIQRCGKLREGFREDVCRR